jgi:hypothetical protein
MSSQITSVLTDCFKWFTTENMSISRTSLQRVDAESRVAIEEMSQALGVSGPFVVRIALLGMYQKIKGLEHVLLPGQRIPVIPDWDTEKG